MLSEKFTEVGERDRVDRKVEREVEWRNVERGGGGGERKDKVVGRRDRDRNRIGCFIP